MKFSFKDLSRSARAALIGGGLAILTLIGFLIYGAVYTVYFDTVVVLCLVLGIAGLGTYALVNKGWSEFLGLAAVLIMSFGVGNFFLNSYPVWADWYGNFNMYGSQGGVTPVILILVPFFAAIICGIVSCFKVKEAK
jgi:hypothetical protein